MAPLGPSLRSRDCPLHILQRHFVSNAVSNVKTLSDSVVNLSGLMVQRIGGI
jgi:hypothetical protein